MRIERGKRRSIVVKTRQRRMRIVVGRFRWGWHRLVYGAGFTVAAKFVLIQVTRYGGTVNQP